MGMAAAAMNGSPCMQASRASSARACTAPGSHGSRSRMRRVPGLLVLLAAVAAALLAAPLPMARADYASVVDLALDHKLYNLVAAAQVCVDRACVSGGGGGYMEPRPQLRRLKAAAMEVVHTFGLAGA